MKVRFLTLASVSVLHSHLIVPAINREKSSPGLAQHLVVIDEDLASTLRLLPGVPPGCDMAVLPRSGTSLRHLTDHLQDCAPLQTLVMVLDGGPGYFRLGGQIIDTPALAQNVGELEGWQQFLAEDARLLLLVDGLGDGPQGQGFTRHFSQCLRRPVLSRPLPETREVLSALSRTAQRKKGVR